VGGDLPGLVHQVFRRHHLRDQPPLVSLLRADTETSPLHDHAHDDAVGHLAHQAGRLHAVDQAQVDVGVEELCVLRGDDDVGVGHQVPAAADAKAVHRADEWLVDRLHHVGPGAVDVVAVGLAQGPGLFRALVDIHAGAESLAVRGDDHHPLLGVVTVLRQNLQQFSRRFRADCVHALRPVQRHADDAAPFLH